MNHIELVAAQQDSDVAIWHLATFQNLSDLLLDSVLCTVAFTDMTIEKGKDLDSVTSAFAFYSFV